MTNHTAEAFAYEKWASDHGMDPDEDNTFAAYRLTLENTVSADEDVTYYSDADVHTAEDVARGYEWSDVEQGRYDDDPSPYAGDYSEM